MGAFANVNLNIVWVIALLLLVIIILSGVKVCNKNTNINHTLKNDNRFMNPDYNYISEPFEETPTPDPIIKQFQDLSQSRIDKTFRRTLNQEKKHLEIKNLKDQIESIENKISVLQQMW
jgi:hypothetical protein